MDRILQKLADHTPDGGNETAALAKDLLDLQTHLCGVRDDLSSLAPSNVPGVHLPEAKNELGAVVDTTEKAANSILDACLIFEKAIKDGGIKGDSAHLNGALSTIYEACSFQDLTSQRITKVQRILALVETKLGAVLDRLGIEAEQPGPQTLDDDALAAERALMNGPAMPGQGIDQANIDAMFD